MNEHQDPTAQSPFDGDAGRAAYDDRTDRTDDRTDRTDDHADLGMHTGRADHEDVTDTMSQTMPLAPPPSQEATPHPTPRPTPSSTGQSVPQATAVPHRPSGPHAPAILLGLVCLAIAALALAQELGGLEVDWGNVGPLGITVAGGVLVLLGALGLAASRRRSGD